MCGICGIVNLGAKAPPDVALIRRMIGRLKHRGPDSSGYYRDRRIALGHTRLSIIDLEGGSQPLCNEDGSLWISYNGELYNYIELASKLIKLGHIMQTKSDTEVIIHAYEEWGPNCFNEFNGQWALAIWDSKKQKLILSRDRVGIRPLYYSITPEKLVFASEVKAIFADPGIERHFDSEGLAELFTFWCPVAPVTVFKNIYEVQPGYYAIIENGKLITEPYWSLSYPVSGSDAGGSDDANSRLLRDGLIEASRLRFLRSDVPVGSYLSGGIDSSIISAVVNRYTEANLKTFSIRFKDHEFDEGEYQKEMINKLGTVHEHIMVSSEDIGTVFPSVIWHSERPILRTAPAPLYLLSRLVKEAGYKVVVTGEGSDEVLAGYDIFREAKVRHFLAKNPSSQKRAKILSLLYPWMHRSPGQIPAFARLFFGRSLDPSDPGFSHRPRWETTSQLLHLMTPERNNDLQGFNVAEKLLNTMPDGYNKWDRLSIAQWLEIKTLLSGYILSSQGDRMLMAHSVEGRFPFLDVNLIEFANRLPPRHKLFALNEKHLLKLAFKDMIPASIFNRPKQPYRAPDASSFFFKNDKPLEWVGDLLKENSIKQAGIFDWKKISLLMKKCHKVEGKKMSNSDNMRIVAVLSTMLCYHHFIQNNGMGSSDEKPAEPMKIIDKGDNG